MFGLLRVFAIAAVLTAAAVAGGAARANGNPYGVMLWPGPGENAEIVLARARGLGVSWYRPPTVYAARWSHAIPCPVCRVYADSGLNLVLSVRAEGNSFERGPARPPTDLAAYRRELGALLDVWHPAMLVVESEEDNPRAFETEGDPVEAYLAELKAACAVAHTYSVACANGGISGRGAAAVTWMHFLERREPDRACDFARRALASSEAEAATLCSYRTPSQVPEAERNRVLGNAGRFAAWYRDAPIDAVNFHWFGRDARALAEVAGALQQITGKPPMTNEMGQRRGQEDADNVRSLLRAAFAAGLKVAVWYSLDTADTVSLFGPDGRLRPTGWEFQRQLSGLR